MKRRLTAATLVLAVGPFAIAPLQADEDYVSLYERLGGLKSIAPVVDDFVERLLNNPVLNRNSAISGVRRNTPPAYLKFQLSQLVCERSGGPCTYSGQATKEDDEPLAVTLVEWEIMTAELRRSLEKFRIPAEEQAELLDLFNDTRGDVIAGMELPDQ